MQVKADVSLINEVIMFSIISIDDDLNILNKFCNHIIDKIKIDSKDIEKYDKEIYDKNGEFLEILNPLFEDLWGLEQLLIRCVYYELNTLREYNLNLAISEYYFKELSENEKLESYPDLILKHQLYFDILSDNNYNYDNKEIINYRRNHRDKIDDNNLIELLLFFGNVARIPINLRKKFENTLNKRNIKSFKGFFKKYPIKESPHWKDMEKLRKITNSLKHQKGFKSIVKDEPLNIGEKYALNIDDALEMIQSTSLFFHELYQFIK
jgi:hypothetical protein